MTQKQTLRAMEALMYWSDYNQYPPESKLLSGYHEVVIETTNIKKEDPVSGKMIRISTSSPLCTTADMNRFIDTAVMFLLEADIPPNMIEPISEKNFVQIYKEWYKFRSVDSGSIDDIKNWDEYCRRFPYDEFLCVLVPEKGTGQTQKIHIVSRGAAADAIDEPWNWIRGSTSYSQKDSSVWMGCCVAGVSTLNPESESSKRIGREKGDNMRIKWLRKKANLPPKTQTEIGEIIVGCLNYILTEYGVETLFMKTDLTGGVTYRLVSPEKEEELEHELQR